MYSSGEKGREGGVGAAQQCNRSNLPPPIRLKSLINSAVRQLVSEPSRTLQQPDVTVVVSRNRTNTLSLPLRPPALLFVYLPPDGMWFAFAARVFFCVCLFQSVGTAFRHQPCQLLPFVCAFPDDGSHFFGF